MKRATEILDYLKNKPHIIEEMETIWFVADIHHSHSKVIRIHNRPVSLSEEKLKLFSKDEQNFDNKEYREEISKEHTQWLIKDVVNKWVKKKHTVYFLGDLSFAPKIEAEKFIDRLNGNKFLIIGNHDKNILNRHVFLRLHRERISHLKEMILI
ncbi:MAG: metallophosphoesterase [Nanoarchaeota archaeon]